MREENQPLEQYIGAVRPKGQEVKQSTWLPVGFPEWTL